MSWKWIGVVALVACGRTGPELGGEGRTPKHDGGPSEPSVGADGGEPACEAAVEACGELPFELPKAYRCDLGAPELLGQSVFAAATRSGLYLVRGGEPEPVRVHTFSLVADDDSSLGVPHLLTRGNWIAVALTRRPRAGNAFLLEFVVADGSGRVAFREIFRSDNSGLQYELHGNDRGLFVLSLEWQGARTHHIVHPEGALAVTDAFTVAGDPGPDGWVLVRDSSDPAEPGYDWFDLLGWRRRRSCHRDRPKYAPVWPLSPGIAYVVNEASELVYEHAFERCRVALPEVPQSAYDVHWTNRQGWVELGWRDAGLNILTANVATGSQIPGYALNSPPRVTLNEDGWTSYPRKALVDFAGATVTSTSRTDSGGATYYQMHRTFDGTNWEAIGNELLLLPRTASTRTIVEASGTYLLGAYWLNETGGGNYFTHVVRRETGVVSDIRASYGTIVVSEDGRCVGTIGEGGVVKMIDMEMGTTHEGPRIDVEDARLAEYGFVSVAAN